VKDVKEEGLFGKSFKMPTGNARKLQAQKAYTDGKEALSNYIIGFNTGLMRETNVLVNF
jgi:hypothetical protein